MAKKKQLTEEEAKALQDQAVVEDEDSGDTRPDEQVLIDEIQVVTPIGDIMLRPWTYGDYYRIAGKIEDIFDIIEEKELNLEGFNALGSLGNIMDFSEEITDENREKKMKEIEMVAATTTQANRDVRKLINTIAPHAMPILVYTTGKTQEEIESLPLQMIISIGIIIYFQNVGILGNALGLFGLNLNLGEPVDED